MKKRWTIPAAIGGVALLTVVLGAVHAYREVTRSIDEGYALWATSDIIIAHHWRTASWPRTWDDLRDYLEYSRHLAGHSLNDLERLVAVDFPGIAGLDTSDLPRMNDYIRLRSGRSGVWRRPQEIFTDYLTNPEGFSRREMLTPMVEPSAAAPEPHHKADGHAGGS